MKKSSLISAILLSHPALALSTQVLAETATLSRQAQAVLLQQSFQSDQIFTSEDGAYRLIVEFALIDVLPVSTEKLDYTVNVKAVDVKTGEVLDDGMSYYAKTQSADGAFKLFNCDSTQVCKVDQVTDLSLSLIEGQSKLKIEDANAIHLFAYYLNIAGEVTFSEVK